jgi:hypothetical protein
MHSDAPIDLRIKTRELEIVKQCETIAILEVDGHEVTDAKKRLGEMLVSLESMLRSKEAHC